MRQFNNRRPDADVREQDLQDLGKALGGLGAALLALYLVHNISWLVPVLGGVALLHALWAIYLAWHWLRGG